MSKNDNTKHLSSPTGIKQTLQPHRFAILSGTAVARSPAISCNAQGHCCLFISEVSTIIRMAPEFYVAPRKVKSVYPCKHMAINNTVTSTK